MVVQKFIILIKHIKASCRSLMLGLRLIECRLCKSFYCLFFILYLYVNYIISHVDKQIFQLLQTPLYRGLAIQSYYILYVSAISGLHIPLSMRSIACPNINTYLSAYNRSTGLYGRLNAIWCYCHGLLS